MFFEEYYEQSVGSLTEDTIVSALDEAYIGFLEAHSAYIVKGHEITMGGSANSDFATRVFGTGNLKDLNEGLVDSLINMIKKIREIIKKVIDTVLGKAADTGKEADKLLSDNVKLTKDVESESKSMAKSQSRKEHTEGARIFKAIQDIKNANYTIPAFLDDTNWIKRLPSKMTNNEIVILNRRISNISNDRRDFSYKHLDSVKEQVAGAVDHVQDCLLDIDRDLNKAQNVKKVNRQQVTNLKSLATSYARISARLNGGYGGLLVALETHNRRLKRYQSDLEKVKE